MTLEGDGAEPFPYQGNVTLELERAANNSDVWLPVAKANAGFWENSTRTKKKYTFSNIGQPGSVMRVIARFSSNWDLVDEAGSISHMFVR